MTEAGEMSLDELELLAWAANSNRAEAALTHFESVYAAVGACWGKNGKQIASTMRGALKKQIFDS